MSAFIIYFKTSIQNMAQSIDIFFSIFSPFLQIFVLNLFTSAGARGAGFLLSSTLKQGKIGFKTKT